MLPELPSDASSLSNPKPNSALCGVSVFTSPLEEEKLLEAPLSPSSSSKTSISGGFPSITRTRDDVDVDL